MHTTDKVTRPFLLKLLLLFALLLSGAMLKTSGLKGTVENNTAKRLASPQQVQEEKEEADLFHVSPVKPTVTSVSM